MSIQQQQGTNTRPFGANDIKAMRVGTKTLTEVGFYASRVQVLGNDTRPRVIGVMPEGHRFPLASEAWMPIASAHPVTSRARVLLSLWSCGTRSGKRRATIGKTHWSPVGLPPELIHGINEDACTLSAPKLAPDAVFDPSTHSQKVC